MPADLHCHTKLSDGSVNVDELVGMAHQRGIQTIAVTDHDTYAGVPLAILCGKRYGVGIIPGVEISTFDYQRKRKAHILCYSFQYPEKLDPILKKTEENRKRAGFIMLEKVLKLYPITRDMVLRRAEGSTNLYKQHIMHALMDAGYTNAIYGPLFYELFDSKDGAVYASVAYPEVRDIIPLIHEAGGVAVLAHPAEYNSYELLEELADQGLDGVEVSHPRNKEGDEEKLCAFAKEKGLIMTGGTDFHGMYSSRFHPIGTFLTEDSQIERLKK